MKRKYWVLLGTAIIVMALVLTGCAAPAAAPADAPAAEAGDGGAAALPPITILINDSPWFPGFEALVNRYIEETGNALVS